MERDAEPLVGFLTSLGVSRVDVLGSLVIGAREHLMERIPTLPPTRLQALVLASFKYIERPELTPIVLAALDALQEFPPELIEALVGPKRDLLAFMPIHVRHKVWERDAPSFLEATHPLILDRIEQPEASRHQLLSAIPSDPVKRRRESASTQKLVELVGSRSLYLALIRLLRDIFAHAGTHEERGQLASLRSDLAMLLHEKDDPQRPITRWETEHRRALR
jgi:hypothetical protein